MNYLKNIPFTNQKNAKKDDEDHTYIEICSQSQILPSPTTTAPINLPVDVEVVDLSLKGRFINNKVVLILCGIFFIIAIVSPIIGLFYHKQLKTHYFTCAVHVYETYNERIGNDIKLFDFVALSLFDFTKKYQRSSHEMFNNKVKENINLVRTAIRIYKYNNKDYYEKNCERTMIAASSYFMDKTLENLEKKKIDNLLIKMYLMTGAGDSTVFKIFFISTIVSIPLSIISVFVLASIVIIVPKLNFILKCIICETMEIAAICAIFKIVSLGILLFNYDSLIIFSSIFSVILYFAEIVFLGAMNIIIRLDKS